MRTSILVSVAALSLLGCSKKEAGPAPAPPPVETPPAPAETATSEADTASAPEPEADTSAAPAPEPEPEADASATAPAAEADASAAAAPEPEADAGAAAAADDGGAAVFAVDAGPKASEPLDLTKLPTEKVDKALCSEGLSEESCDGEEGLARCALRILYTAPEAAAATAPFARVAILDCDEGEIPGPTQSMYVVTQKAGAAWEIRVKVGDGEVGGMGTRQLRSVGVIAHGTHDFGALGPWVWLDVMQVDAAPDAGTQWWRTEYLCGGADGACHAVPLKYWFSPKTEDSDGGGPDGPKATREMFAFAMTVAADGAVAVSSKTKVPDDMKGVVGTHRLEALPAPPEWP